MLHFTKVTEKLESIQRQASKTRKGSKANQWGPGRIQPTEERFLVLEGLSHGKRSIIVSCGFKEGRAKIEGQNRRRFQRNKRKTFLTVAGLFKDRIGSLRRQSPISCNHLAERHRKSLFKHWLTVWDQVSFSLSVIQGQTESEPANVLTKQKIIGIQKIMQVPGPLSSSHDSEGESAWESALSQALQVILMYPQDWALD